MIWKFRNAAIFEDVSPNMQSAICLILNSIKEANFYRLGSMHNNVNELHILHLLNIKGVAGSTPKIVSITWQPPPSAWIKVNTNGSALGSPGAAGAGGIFHTTAGFPRGAFSFNLGCDFAYVAELSAAIYALEIAWNKGWHTLWLECDSIWVVQLLSSKSKTVPWKIKHRWLRCLTYISRMNFKVSHIYREGNSVADSLAKHGVSSSISSFSWWDSAPFFVILLFVGITVVNLILDFVSFG